MRPRALVIGGGLAGIAAAEVLAKAQFEVTLLEADSCLGGKAAGFKDGLRPYEHGVHGFWPNYLNLFALLERAGVSKEEFFQRSNGTRTVIPGVGDYKNVPLQREVPAPWHVFAHLVKTPYLRWVDKLSMIPAGLAMLAFDPQDRERYAEYDEFTFRGWLWRKGVSAKTYSRLLEPFARALTFDSSSRISAATVISSFQLYLLRGQRDIEPYWLKKNPAEIYERLQKYLESLGVRILLDTQVTELKLDAGGWVEEVGYEARSGTKPEGDRFEEVLFIKDTAIQPGELKTFPSNAPFRPVHARRTGQDDLIAFDSLCTHSNNLTRIEGGGFRCDAHGSMFDPAGNPTAGEARRALAALKVERRPGGWSVQSDLPRVYEQTDYVVSAAHLTGFRRFITPDFLDKPFFRAVENLETTPVIVGRFWFKGKLEDIQPYSSGFFVGDTLTDAFFVLPSAVENETVVETQAYLVRDVIHLGPKEIEDLLLRDLKVAFPGLAGLSYACPAKILKYPDRFSLYEAGSDLSRPGVRTPVPNLFLAGDWVHVDRPVWNMERAVVSGILAGREALTTFGRDPDATSNRIEVLDLPPVGLAYRLIHRVARCVHSISAWWRRWRRRLRLRMPPMRHRLPDRPERPSTTSFHLICKVRKFVGQPNESSVRGMLQYEVVQSPTLSASPPVYRVTGGVFKIDLASISTRNQRRDDNLKSLFFKVSALRYLDVYLKEVRKAADGDGYDVDLEVAGIPVAARARKVAEPGEPSTALDITARITPSIFKFLPQDLSHVCSPEDAAEVTTRIDTALPYWQIGEKVTPLDPLPHSGPFRPLVIEDEILGGSILEDDSKPEPEWPKDETINLKPRPRTGFPL